MRSSSGGALVRGAVQNPKITPLPPSTTNNQKSVDNKGDVGVWSYCVYCPRRPKSRPGWWPWAAGRWDCPGSPWSPPRGPWPWRNRRRQRRLRRPRPPTSCCAAPAPPCRDPANRPRRHWARATLATGMWPCHWTSDWKRQTDNGQLDGHQNVNPWLVPNNPRVSVRKCKRVRVVA